MARKTSFLTAAGLVLLVLSSCGPQHGSILPNLRQELDRHPDMTVEDLYKFIHQAAFGNKHVLEHGDAHLLLLQEWDEITADPNEQMTEDLSPDGSVVRLNLRPFKAHGGDPDTLWTVLQRSGDAEYPGEDAFQDWWEEAMGEAKLGTLPVNPGEMQEYYDARWKEGLPAVDHSDEYETEYAPSYRVLLRSELKALGL